MESVINEIRKYSHKIKSPRGKINLYIINNPFPDM